MKVLITGITGQDGIFLTKIIQNKHKEFEILGISRSTNNILFKKIINYSQFTNNQIVQLININLLNKVEVSKLIKDFKPNFIYNLSGPSSVYESLNNPNIENQIKLVFKNLTESLIEDKNFCRFFQASSSEMFGSNKKTYIFDENDDFFPNSPYARGKLANHLEVQNLKLKFDWNIYSGIMFNHESEYRKKEYLLMQLLHSAKSISNGDKNKFSVGSLEYVRDWSYAKDIANGIYLLTNYGKDSSYVLGSGKGTSIEELIKIIFNYFKINYKEYIVVDRSKLRPNDKLKIISKPLKINKELGWKTELTVENFCEKIIKSLN